MDIKDLFKTVEGADRLSGTRSYILLEGVVSRLLASQAEEEGKSYASNIRLWPRMKNWVFTMFTGSYPRTLNLTTVLLKAY